MRIIAGEFRSRRLHTPKDDSVTRPIADRVKESLFGLLRGHCEGASVFDGFAGTGAIGLEVLSRGGARCVFIEQDRDIAGILAKNIEMLDIKDRAELVIGDALGAGALARAPRPLTLAFLDPPYPLVREPMGYKRVMAQLENLISLLTPDGFAVLRTPWPFKHPVGGAAPAPVPQPAAPKKKFKKFNKRRDDYEALDDDPPVRSEAPEAVEAEVDEPPAPTIPMIDVDLTLPTAVGPETHVYHSMALHLYMRKK